MSLIARVSTLVAALVAGLLLVGTWAAPVLAQVGDNDGFDGDELAFPLLLGAAIVIGGIAFWRSRRSQPRSG